MAGLLGDGWDSPQSQGLLALAAGMIKGDFGGGVNAMSQTIAGSQDRDLKRKHAQMLMDANQRKVKQEEAQAMEAERIRALIRGAGRPMGATNQVNSALPPDLQIGAQSAIAPQIDYQELIRQGVPFEQVKALAESRNFGRDKVARTAEIEGPNGSKLVQGFDEYGQRVGQGEQGYVAPQLIDTGDRKLWAKPDAGQSFQMGMSPSNQIAIRGQNMTDSRARDLNAISQQANGIKLSEKQAAADLAKAGQVASFDVMLGSLDRLGKHPGLARSVGITGAFPTMPGSESANFKAELDTFQSQAFLPMVSQLKGMGALSDAEGKKLTAAVGALNPAMGEQAFRASISRITKDMDAARGRLTGTNTGGAGGDWGKPKPSGAPMKGQVIDGFKFKGGNPSDPSNWEKQ
jgi:hypothetical protein